MDKIKYKILIVLLSIKWMLRVNLGDYVWYNGEKHMVLNGVRSDSWRLNDIDYDSGWVRRSKCKKVISLNNICQSFSSGYNFYMTNWYQLWISNGIKPWMKQCDIW
jgi:hypothetical protein